LNETYLAAGTRPRRDPEPETRMTTKKTRNSDRTWKIGTRVYDSWKGEGVVKSREDFPGYYMVYFFSEGRQVSTCINDVTVIG
jgi:hypothetical protein